MGYGDGLNPLKDLVTDFFVCVVVVFLKNKNCSSIEISKSLVVYVAGV